jgi:Mannose-6-phosphate isomerase
LRYIADSRLLAGDLRVRHISPKLVNPSGHLSLQSHFYRSERWAIVSELTTFAVDGILMKLSRGEFVANPFRPRTALSVWTTACSLSLKGRLAIA